MRPIFITEPTNVNQTDTAQQRPNGPRGAPPRAIQELAGHRELGMTQRYMHLSPAALDSAIRLLDRPAILQNFGDILETGGVSDGKING